MDYRIITLITLIPFICASASGQAYSEKRTFSRTVHVEKDATLEVNNKYGTIQITTWDRDSVSIRAEIEAFAPNKSRLSKMLEGVDVTITDSRYKIVAETNFTQTISMLFESFKGITGKLIPYDSRVQINYYIKMPDYLSGSIINKYGDVYMEDNTGKISISLSNGSLRANSLAKVSDMHLTFCDATINYMQEGNINTSFSEISIGESGNLNIESTSSRFDLKTVESIITESRRDKFYIGSLSSLKGNSYFTDFSIERLTGEMDLSPRYGSLNTDNISKNFGLITINSGFCDVDLEFEIPASYNLDLKYSNSFVTLPVNNEKFKKEPVNEEKKEYMVYGTVGKTPGSRKVRIDANRGSVILK